ncbi:MAG: CDP-diacylglycerol--glycerol-3-phosphate 3-phosphatidyltransferase [Firmicutes bacterium]|nr:CDP-diacylglycerol--glycerol-3-phosphate 3-phosphatidyltransferase [Bacillota bacterium]
MNLPNKLTMLRIFLIPIFIVLLMFDLWYVAAGVFIAASITDALDGMIARKMNLITNFGKLMDPLADKLLVTAALVCFVQLEVLDAWMVIVILAREFLVTGLRTVAAGQGIILAAGVSGKLKTIFQMVAIIVILLQDWPFTLVTDAPVGLILMWIAVILTIYSGAEYIIKNRRVFQE